MASQSQSQASGNLLLAAAWGQALGLLGKAIFLVVEDSPSFFARVSPWAFILPVIAVGVLYLTRLRSFLSNNLSPGMLSLFVILISLSTLLISAGDLFLAFSIPEDLVTEGWEYTRITSLLSTLLFTIAFAVNLILAARSLRSRPASSASY